MATKGRNGNRMELGEIDQSKQILKWKVQKTELLGIYSLEPKNKKHAWVFEFIAYLELSGFLRWYGI